MNKCNFDDIYYPSDIINCINKNTDEKMIDHIRNANKEYLDTLAMKYLGIKITYRQLFNQINVYARALKAYGLHKGDMITICLQNSPETVYYFYACNDIGVTPYLVDPRSTFNKLKVCITDSNSKLFVCEMSTYYTKVAQYEHELPVEKIVVVSPIISFEGQKKLSVKQISLKSFFDINLNP